MRFHILICSLAVIALAAIDLHAQTNVPAIAQDEIARRGNHVEHTGTIRSGLMAQALSPPADDSAKWFLTLIVKPGEAASEKMRTTLADNEALRPWIDTRDPAKSTLHYHVRSVDDPTQADWLLGLKPALQKTGTPILVLQPPKNGQFGDSGMIVKILAGVISGEDLSKKLREAIITYVMAIESPGISQSVGAPPPFQVPPKDPAPCQPVAPAVPFEWPPVHPAPAPAPESPANPQVPATPLPTGWLAISLIGTFVAGWVAARMKTLVGTKVDEINRAIATLKSAQKPPKE